VSGFGADEALACLRIGIRRLNDVRGAPKSTTRGYRETITRAYVLLIAVALTEGPPAPTLEVPVSALLAGRVGARGAPVLLLARPSPLAGCTRSVRRARPPPDRARWKERRRPSARERFRRPQDHIQTASEVQQRGIAGDGKAVRAEEVVLVDHGLGLL